MHIKLNLLRLFTRARAEDDAESDIDMLIVGRTTERVDVSNFEQRLRRKITRLIYTPQEWDEKTESSENDARYCLKKAREFLSTVSRIFGSK